LTSHQEVFSVGNVGEASKIKMKIKLDIIYIDRPVNWSIENVSKIATEIKNIENFNYTIKQNH
jgi:hypothetical protein